MRVALLAGIMLAACLAGCGSRSRDAETNPNRPRTGELHFDADSVRSDTPPSTTQQ